METFSVEAMKRGGASTSAPGFRGGHPHHGHQEGGVSKDRAQGNEIEAHFKAKYNQLRQIYELKIKEMATTVHNLCEQIVNDDTLSQLARDQISISFVPAHITEIFETHLKSERATHVHSYIQQIAQLQLENKELHAVNDEKSHAIDSMSAEIQAMKESGVTVSDVKAKLRALTQEFEIYSKESEASIDKLTQAREKDAQQLSQRDDVIKQLNLKLEQSQQQAQQLTHDLHASKTSVVQLQFTLDASKSEISTLSEQLRSNSQVLQHTQQELQALTIANTQLCSDLERSQQQVQQVQQQHVVTQQQLQQKTVQESECTRKLSTLMSQVLRLDMLI